MDLKKVITSALSKLKSPQDQVKEVVSVGNNPQEMQKQALNLVMAGTTAPLVGNQPKIAGTLTDVSNLAKLSPDDYMGAIGNMRQLVAEILPNQAKNKSMQALANKDVESWMQKMAQEIIKKTKIYPSMAE